MIGPAYYAAHVAAGERDVLICRHVPESDVYTVDGVERPYEDVSSQDVLTVPTDTPPLTEALVDAALAGTGWRRTGPLQDELHGAYTAPVEQV